MKAGAIMRLIIDRFEGQYAVCEVFDEKRMINLEKKTLPEDAEVGDVLDVSEAGIMIDIDETESRKKRIKGLLDSLWE